MLGQQAQNQAAAFIAVVAIASTATANVVATAAPAEVPSRNVGIGILIHKLVEQFFKLNPPKFTGVGDPEAIALWIQGLEKTFALLMCTETKKVVLATYQLEEVTSTWWRTTQRVIFLEGVAPEWNAFVEVFNGKYFSETVREMKMAEFQRLRQGLMTVDQYEAKFAELS
ncbi:uncharacterized protein LOC120291859 [Eucalyptus grandis]|uniref:uncharacterized protein LOC120291859 n=1 Tax=Eucalyptus grandis TaxID=71139 RepID=UPI00192EE3AB|nr:uncharacterized protein LOC120291859 [Eucalyptus grandis]